MWSAVFKCIGMIPTLPHSSSEYTEGNNDKKIDQTKKKEYDWLSDQKVAGALWQEVRR